MELRPTLRELNARPHPSVVLVRAGALGDTVLLLPALRLLAHRLPGARITLVGSNWARRLRPLADREWDFFPFESPQLAPLFDGSPRDLPEPLRTADALVLYTSRPEGPFALNIDRCLDRSRAWSVEPSGTQHAAAHFASALTTDPVTLDQLPQPSLQTDAEMRQMADRCLRNLPGPHDQAPVTLHPGSGSPRKCWPPDRFAALARQLLEDHHRVVVLEGPADEHARKTLLARVPHLPVLQERDLATVAGILAASAICVTNDSGIGHLSAALGTPTVSIFGPTNPALWRPLGPRAIAVSEKTGAWPAVHHVRRAIQQMPQRPRRRSYDP